MARSNGYRIRSVDKSRLWNYFFLKSEFRSFQKLFLADQTLWSYSSKNGFRETFFTNDEQKKMY